MQVLSYYSTKKTTYDITDKKLVSAASMRLKSKTQMYPVEIRQMAMALVATT